MFAGAGDRVPALVEKLFDPQDHFNVLPFIYTMAGFRFLRRQIGELGLPESEDESLNLDDLANLADPEEEFVGNFRCRHKDLLAADYTDLADFNPLNPRNPRLTLRRSLHALLNYNGGPREWKSLADPVFDEAFEREVKFPHLI